MAYSVSDSDGVCFVPSFSGLQVQWACLCIYVRLCFFISYTVGCGSSPGLPKVGLAFDLACQMFLGGGKREQETGSLPFCILTIQ